MRPSNIGKMTLFKNTFTNIPLKKIRNPDPDPKPGISYSTSRVYFKQAENDAE